MKFASILTALLVSSFPVWADGDHDLRSKPGYVDFGKLAAHYGEPRVMVDISESLLRLASAMTRHDPVAEAALRDIESVRVHVYNTAGDVTAAAAHMQDVSKTLRALNWEQIVRVREADENVDIYVKHGENEIHGLTVMKVGDDEAVFVNVLGDINPAELSAVMDRVNVEL